jgi:alkylated DNA repair dioxygenase AlkB
VVNAFARDLFDEPAVPGLRHAENIVTAAEEQALIERIDACDLEPFKFQQWLGKRLTASFGSRYDFERGQMAPAPPIPDWLLPVRAQVAAFAELDPALLVQALVIRYDPGAGIGWHRDRPVYGQVTGLSLGEPAVLRLRRRRAAGFERASVALAPPRRLSAVGRGAPRLGAQHRPARADTLVDHLPHACRSQPRPCLTIAVTDGT